MKSLREMSTVAALQRGAVPTGAHCPQTGWWFPAGEHGKDARYLWRGALMPAVNGRTVGWHLSKADPAGTSALNPTIYSADHHPIPYSSAQALWPDCLD